MKLAQLLSEFIENFAEKDQKILSKDNQDIYLNIDEIKEAHDLKKVKPAALVALALVLMKQL